VGDAGFYWSSTAYPDVNNAYYLLFNRTVTFPSLYDARWLGFSADFFAPFSSYNGEIDLDVGFLEAIAGSATR